MSKDKFNKAKFIRLQIVKHEGLTLEQLHAAWKKQNGTPRELPTQQDIYVVVSSLRSKYGVATLPYLSSGRRKGELNFSALARSIKAKRSDLTASNIHNMMERDGFVVTLPTIIGALRDDHPDPKVSKGPRAGKPKIMRRTVNFDRRSKKGRVGVAELLIVKQLIKDLGGADKTRKALEAVGRAGSVEVAQTALDALEELQI
jgi:hypothetical protein